jgi:hypothetical protein
MKLKQHLTVAPSLATLLDEGEYVVGCDASYLVTWNSPSTKTVAKLRVIAYASRLLGRHETAYITIRKVLVTVIFALGKWQQNLLVRDILSCTDHAV